MKKKRTSIGVVVPLANEEGTIIEFLTRALCFLGPDDRIYCVLDNLSKDRTQQLIRDKSKTENRIVLVWAPENRCVVDAYFKGYSTAYNAGHTHILEMDGGLSHLPEEMPLFLKNADAGYDFVGGSRFIRGGKHRSPINRVMVSYIGTVLARIILGTKMTDMTSGFELFSRKAMQSVLEKGVKSRANFFQTEIRFQMHRFKWVEVPITYQNENTDIGRSAIRESLRIMWSLRRERRNYGL